jgi:prevent-host-death family protein
METIGVSELRANLMKVLKKIEQGASLTVTSRGKPVAKLVPPDYSRREAKEKLHALGKTAEVHDIISPIDEPWDMES